MKDKKVKRDMHEDFCKLLIEIQNKRIKNGMEKVQDKIALWRLTKTITNMLKANPELINQLSKVKIEDEK